MNCPLPPGPSVYGSLIKISTPDSVPCKSGIVLHFKWLYRDLAAVLYLMALLGTFKENMFERTYYSTDRKVHRESNSQKKKGLSIVDR